MSRLSEWNALPEAEAMKPILACCGSQAFARGVVRARPYPDVDALIDSADGIWWSLRTDDWLEAFACHPRIGESLAHGSAQFSAWSGEEQSKARGGSQALNSLLKKNHDYESRHGFLYIVCASGKSAGELLEILDRRIENSTEIELQEAAEQQRRITNLRLRKWFAA